MYVEEEAIGEEVEYKPDESTLALMYQDDAGPDFYVGMDADPANAPLMPMPTAVPPPPMRNCEQRHCRFHAAEDVHQHRLSSEGRRQATLLVGALKRYEFQPRERVAREKSLAALPAEGDRVRCVQPGDTVVLDHHPREVRAAQQPEHLPPLVRLSVGRLLEGAELEGVSRDTLYVALWRNSASAWRLEHGVRPLTPQALGSHVVLVALRPGGMEAVFGDDGTNRLSLTVDSAVLAPTSDGYRLVNRGGSPRLPVVVGEADTGHREPEQCVAVEEDSAASTSAGHRCEAARDDAEGPSTQGQRGEQGQGQGPTEVGVVDVKAHVEAALTRIMAAASPLTAEAMEEDDQSRERSRKMGEADEEDEGLGIPGAREAHEVERGEMEVADRASPRTEEVETRRHWAKGRCMRADACRFAHPQPPLPLGVPQDMLLILGAIARVGALSLHRSKHHETMLREVVETAHGGGLPALGYAVAHGGRTVWAVALPCGMTVLLTPFPVVPWWDMVTLQEASLGWVGTRHTHPPSMDPHGWQAQAGDQPVMGAAHGARSLDALVGQSAELGQGRWCCSRLPGPAP